MHTFQYNIIGYLYHLKEIGAENIIIKKYGKIGINTDLIEIEGDKAKIAEEFNWL